MVPYTAHTDTFARDRLPPVEEMPDFLFDLPELQYPARLNAATELLDRWLERGGGRPCLIGSDGSWSYAETAARVNRIANVLVEDLGLEPGNRVLLRFANSPIMAAICLAVLKAGGIVVATMPLLRAGELRKIVDKAQISLAFCDVRLADEMEKTRERTSVLTRIVYANSEAANGLDALMKRAGDRFEPCDTAADDVALIAFTSGTTGEPKGTMHFHRDLLATCDSYGAHVLKPTRDDRFIGSPPLAFTFGLGGLVLFPLRVGASTVLIEQASPANLTEAIARHRATVCFTAPTAYRAILGLGDTADLTSLRICVSAGESLPKATFEDWQERTGIAILDGIGATEMLHIFIGAPAGKVKPGSTGLVVPGYEARIIGADGREAAPGIAGRLAVRGPTGCRYLADSRQRKYVEDGWNFTGDTFMRDAEGYFWYQARGDDMIISSGYNIAGPEVEAALLTHPAVAECGVVGAPDAARGQIVQAYVVLKRGEAADDAMIKRLQDYVKAEIAPHKYPRRIVFVDQLPRTQTGKLQRFHLRDIAAKSTLDKAG